MTPVVISENGYGLAVTPVDSGGIPAVVAENGYGMPIVIVESGGVPMVIEGLAVLFTIADANPLHDFDFTDDTTKTYASGKISVLADKGSVGFNATQGTASLQPVDNVETLNGKKVGTYDGGDELDFDINIASAWTMLFLVKLDSTDTRHEIIKDLASSTIAVLRFLESSTGPIVQVNSMNLPIGWGVRKNGLQIVTDIAQAGQGYNAFVTDDWVLGAATGLGDTGGARTVGLGGRPLLLANTGCTGHFARVVVIPTHDATTVAKVEGALAWENGLEGILDPGHAHASSPPTVDP